MSTALETATEHWETKFFIVIYMHQIIFYAPKYTYAELVIGERERANLVVRLARFFYNIYINYIYFFLRVHTVPGYPVFADTLHTCSIHIRNVKVNSSFVVSLHPVHELFALSRKGEKGNSSPTQGGEKEPK